jgi:hypothetical protein
LVTVGTESPETSTSSQATSPLGACGHDGRVVFTAAALIALAVVALIVSVAQRQLCAVSRRFNSARRQSYHSDFWADEATASTDDIETPGECDGHSDRLSRALHQGRVWEPAPPDFYYQFSMHV